MLSQRLRELEACQVVRRRTLPPPAGVAVYELTDWGRELEPVLLSLARWGSRTAVASDKDLSVDALLIALQTTFDPERCEIDKARVELRLGGDVAQALVSRRRIVIERGEQKPFDAAISTNAACLRRVVFGRETLAQARRSGELVIEGDEQVAGSFLRMFARTKAHAS